METDKQFQARHSNSGTALAGGRPDSRNDAKRDGPGRAEGQARRRCANGASPRSGSPRCHVAGDAHPVTHGCDEPRLCRGGLLRRRLLARMFPSLPRLFPALATRGLGGCRDWPRAKSRRVSNMACGRWSSCRKVASRMCIKAAGGYGPCPLPGLTMPSDNVCNCCSPRTDMASRFLTVIIGCH